MPRYYVFKGGPCGYAEDPELIVTADRTGANLPERHSGSWKFLRAITLIPRSSDSVVVSHDSAMDAIAREGYYQIEREIPDLKIRRRSPAEDQFLRSSRSSSRRHT
jgi:hypothetical protein